MTDRQNMIENSIAEDWILRVAECYAQVERARADVETVEAFKIAPSFALADGRALDCSELGISNGEALDFILKGAAAKLAGHSQSLYSSLAGVFKMPPATVRAYVAAINGTGEPRSVGLNPESVEAKR